MQKLRDILYDTSDILVALLIIALAVLVIWTRIDAIMAYPAAGADVTAQVISPQEDPALTGDSGEPDALSSGGVAGKDAINGIDPGPASAAGVTGDGVQTPQADPTPPAVGGDISLYIANGETGAMIAEKLLNAGLIQTRDEFYQAITDANAATRLQAGTFIIPAGSTPAQIVAIITKPA